ncbi:hypothetical protein V6N13_117021 [Hibiscus sabdariffa]|uniref:Uncharacterized protein n=1 Tax=Hibiscus sabdariffa TaxID=183260 RepID=A0ABR2QH42_9ROSI
MSRNDGCTPSLDSFASLIIPESGCISPISIIDVSMCSSSELLTGTESATRFAWFLPLFVARYTSSESGEPGHSWGTRELTLITASGGLLEG